MDQFKQFPMHDAILHRFEVFQDTDGNWSIIFNVEVTDDSYDPGYAIPSSSKITRLCFHRCALIQTEFWGWHTGQDTFFEVEILDASDIISKRKLSPVPIPNAQHYRIRFNSGSQIDLVAQKISLL